MVRIKMEAVMPVLGLGFCSSICVSRTCVRDYYDGKKGGRTEEWWDGGLLALC